jgi:hypothetical protein
MPAAIASVSPHLTWLAERTAKLISENVADLADEAADARRGENRD